MAFSLSDRIGREKLTAFIVLDAIVMAIGIVYTGMAFARGGFTAPVIYGLAGLLVLLFNIVLVRILKSVFVPSLLFLAELAVYLFMTLFFAAEWIDLITAMLWMLVLPMITFFFLGFKRGVIAVSVITFLLLSIMSFRLAYASGLRLEPSPGDKIMVHASIGALYLFVAAFFGLYELTQQKIYRQLLDANLRVRQTMEKLIRAERLAAIGEITSAIAHELRNPLGSLKNVHYFLRTKLGDLEGGRDGRLPEFLGIMEIEIAACDNIINNLLAFARDTRLSLASVNLNRLIEKVLETLSVPGSVRVEWRRNGTVREVPLDEGQMQIVLSNIFRNALQAMPDGGTITVSLSESENSRQINIADTGAGMSGEVVGKLFEPLVSNKNGGTGLGLSISAKIVRAHGGEIKVSSEPGRGSVFTIILPNKSPAVSD